MKKLVLLVAAASLTLALVGCGKKDDDASSAGTPAAGSKIKDKTPATGDE